MLREVHTQLGETHLHQQRGEGLTEGALSSVTPPFLLLLLLLLSEVMTALPPFPFADVILTYIFLSVSFFFFSPSARLLFPAPFISLSTAQVPMLSADWLFDHVS